VADTAPHSLGIGHLASLVFLHGSHRAGAGPRDILEQYIAAEGHRAVSEYARDARDLLVSPLTSDELALIWCAATDGNHGPAQDGVSGREWLQVVHAVTTQRGDPAVLDQPHGDPALIARVQKLTSQFTVGREHRFPECPGGIAGVRRVLRDLAAAGHQDLAFRLFVSMAAHYYMPISASLSQDCAEISRELGHPDYLVEDIAGMVGR